MNKKCAPARKTGDRETKGREPGHSAPRDPKQANGGRPAQPGKKQPY